MTMSIDIIIVKCAHCDKEFKLISSVYNTRINKSKGGKLFCSMSCVYELKRLNIHVQCLNCGKSINKNAMKYCSVECNHEDKYKNYIMAWKNGVITPMKNGCVSKYIRKYLLNKWNNKCQICGWNEKNIYTDNIPLEIDHIDGDSENNAEINLRVLCPNCHSLTSTYGALNVGKGRKR